MTMKMMMMMMRLVMANLFLKYSVVTALESYVKGHGTPGKVGHVRTETRKKIK